MNEQEWLAEKFEAHRSHLQGVAYRMLGSLSEAEDAVQECWLRLSRSDTSEVENLGGWLTTVVSRLCLDMLRVRKSRREDAIDVQTPETLAGQADGSDPEQEALLADAVGLALLIVLGKLSPAERITFVLHDIFAMPFSDIAPIVGKSETAARQLASRARRRVQGSESVPDGDLAHQRELVDAFLAAARRGDFDTLVATLDPDVVVRDDRQAGSIRVTRGARALASQISGRIQASQPALVNGSAGILAAPRGKLLYVLQVTIKHGKIVEIDLISDPARIDQLDLAVWND
ncbi:sigma-70 family RNA polymerase sigma factor [Paenibacillus filicis]|uniref:Sigma-70 family RNA polymerase sigma factor n=1 Tax=Paenibacillus filicis TaxID=669464 RepID=A0ABU9DXG0_9BACL